MSRSLAGAATIFCAAVLMAVPVAAAPSADAVWDLSDLYTSNAAWDQERAVLQKEIAGLARFKGTLGRDAKSMRAASCSET